MFLGKRYCLSSGVGKSTKRLPSFDKALYYANVGNYNLVRLSSILPAKCKKVSVRNIQKYIKEGSLLPVAYSTISSDVIGDTLFSGIMVGIPVDKNKVGVIMEYSALNISVEKGLKTLTEMVKEAFEIRGWELDYTESTHSTEKVDKKSGTVTTFACIAEF